MKPIEYSSASREIVDAFNKRPPSEKTSDYWASPEVEMVRAEIKDHYRIEQQSRCCYCQQLVPVENNAVWDAEHIAPRASHAQFMFEPLNLCVACKDCNSAKRDKRIVTSKAQNRYPARSEAFTIIHPHFDNYSDHIVVHLDIFYSPKTAKGKETVYACDLMRFFLSKAEWNSAAAELGTLMPLLAKLMQTNDPIEQRDLLQSVLLVAQIRVSRQLYYPPNFNSPPPDQAKTPP